MWWRGPLPRLPRQHSSVDFFLRSDSANRPHFCAVHLTAKFHRPMFNRSEVIVLTAKLANKQAPLKTSTSLRNATPVGKYNGLAQ